MAQDPYIIDCGSFLRLNQGANRIRVISAPYQGWFHLFEGKSVKCTKFAGECKICEGSDSDGKRNEPQRRWIVAVINRSWDFDSQWFSDYGHRLFSMGGSIFGEIQKLSRHEKWGDPTKYDLNIVVDQFARPIFTVIPEPKESFEHMYQKNADEFAEGMKGPLENLTDPTTELGYIPWRCFSAEILRGCGGPTNGSAFGEEGE